MRERSFNRAETGVSFPVGWEDKKKLINETLDKVLPRENEPPAIIHRAMRYALFPGGKRLRPVLTLVAAETVGGNSRLVLPAACALELIHAYSLIHDDLPALDNDNYRRGKPSSHKAFGEDIAILAGDALLTRAFGLIGENSEQEGVDQSLILLVIGGIARAVGTRGMIGGQVDDLKLGAGKTISLAYLKSIHCRKTGALLEICLKVGAILGEGNEEEVQALSRYGRNIGLAFQIGDDLLDVPEEEKGKTTYPTLIGVEESRKKMAELVRKAKGELAGFGKKGEILEEIANFIAARIFRV